MTIPEFLARWWRQLAGVLLVLAAVAGYGLARSGGATGGEFSASPPASSMPDPTGSTTEPTAGPGTADGRGGVTSPTGDASADPDGPGPGTGVTASSTTTSLQTTTRPSRSEHWAIRWILSLGPEGPTSPTSDVKPYVLLRDRECGEALTRTDLLTEEGQLKDRTRAIYRGAATACLAAFHQQPQRWAEAGRHLADARSSSEELNCPERATLAWLQLVVGLHEQDPDRTFVAQQPQGFYTSVERLAPDHGPKGEQVRVEGNNLGCVSYVEVRRVGSEPQYPRFTRDPSGDSLTFTAPDGFDPGLVDVTLGGNEDYIIGRATFTYEAGGADSPPGG